MTINWSTPEAEAGANGPFRELVSKKELMRRLGVKSPTTIYNMVARGELPPAIEIGRGTKRWDWAAVVRKVAAAQERAFEALIARQARAREERQKRLFGDSRTEARS
ncbi:helix-turn-helix transcriptional regulator [Parvularcula dongshanensis]|uniref:Putative DNA-binding transcriptional regulator AlpA n=1 Tax=Parvularcula dongshanensis TaxID=1173995 RepID=A0A840I699_9PROT|nr:helix-turn-helix domain-containing protein [Parvularcula dongshanensis]MBB4659952.1 putative DNA-binding transcriptional regulator AlpA [Parvularcula dongshanensis]